MTTRARRIALRILAALLVLLVSDQVAQYAVLGDGWVAGRRIAPFDPPLFTRGQVETLERLARGGTGIGGMEFHAALGWAPAEGSLDTDWIGGRRGGEIVPPERRDGVKRIATYGCSFTYGSEVEGDAAWPAVIDSLRDDLEVINLGVPGYGPDQALLRMRRTLARTRADEVWLGFLPATALRTISVYRPALRRYTVTLAVKPRFVLDEAGVLDVLPAPASSVDDLVRLLRDSERFYRDVVPTDAFMARCPSAYAPRGSRVSHWFATSRVLLTWLERGGRAWQPRLEDPSDEARVLTRAVIGRMAQDASVHGARFRLVVLPDREALAELAASGDRPWRGIVDDLTADGVVVSDLGDALVDAGAVADASMWAPQGHYSADGNRMIAAKLAELAR